MKIKLIVNKDPFRFKNTRLFTAYDNIEREIYIKKIFFDEKDIPIYHVGIYEQISDPTYDGYTDYTNERIEELLKSRTWKIK